MDSPYAKELVTAIEAARLAAQISLSVLSQSFSSASLSSSSNSLIKDDLSPVTIADFAIQALLTTYLSETFPSHGFIGEESADDLRENPHLLQRVLDALILCCPGTEWTPELICGKIDECTKLKSASEGEFVWVFDPIDGTKTFIQGKQFAINIALLQKAKQVVSVVALPLWDFGLEPEEGIKDDKVDERKLGTLLYGVRGYGAFVEPLVNEDGVEAKKLPMISDGKNNRLREVTCTNLDSGVSDLHSLVAERLGIVGEGDTEADLLGWVPRWASLAMGFGNVTVWIYKSRERKGKIWDHAGVMMLFEEVGGKISDVDGKEIDLGIGRKFEGNYGFVGAPRERHGEVVEVVKGVLREAGLS
ncbi:hypothetical protein QBC38DRAFT_53416 [Podospora fimiseda]|uniref:3'(2'),5'-bisphosphate nucleotidase n=1 Tax=Podospora fimiseda TaxID=252190 RepID=A0AAN7BH40_9PEZI|nr:hypothetical protein QBC38DRAFT_53416 [Podospora fimiseda]